jgi:hypothetical protein
MNFARSTTLFVVLGILTIFFGGRSNVAGIVGLFSISLGVLLGILSLFGVGRSAHQPFKAPWITLSLGSMALLVVGISAISSAIQGRAQGDTSVAGGSAAAPLIDQANGFRLDQPGEGWNILSKEELRTLNESAAAGAQSGPDLGGFVFVATLDPGFRIVGREREVGRRLIDQIELDDKRIVFNRADELDGQKAVRCQVVGKIAGRGIRYEIVALIANGRLYRLTALGPSDQTSADGSAFHQFMAAFHLLPTEPQAAPPVPAAPPARK